MNNFQTPKPLCRFIIKHLEETYDIDTTEIVFEPTPGEGNFISVLKEMGYGFDIPHPTDDIFEYKFPHPYRVIIGNPPWTPMELGYQILDLCFDNLDPYNSILVFILPWLFLINSDTRAKKYFPHLTEIIHLPRTTFKGARIQSAIFFFEKHKKHQFSYLSYYDIINPPLKSQQLKEFLK